MAVVVARRTRIVVGFMAGGACVGAVALAIPGLGGGTDSLAAAEPRADVSRQYARLPLRFEVNRGQAPGKVEFLARGAGYTMSLGRDGAVLALAGRKGGGGIPAAGSRAVGMSLVGSNPRPEITGVMPLEGTSNYIVGSDRRDWRTGVPSYAQVRYGEVYPGIDMIFKGNQRELRYDFIVAPGSDPARIAIAYPGAERLSIARSGDLLVHAPGGAIRQRRPVIFQGSGADRRRVAGSYVLERDGRNVRFEIGAYDRTRPLVIDPTIVYSTHLGGFATSGSKLDFANGIAVDASGSAYVVGLTDSVSPPYPTTPGALQTGFKGGTFDAFVTKLNPAGDGIVYSTYIGGTGDDRANDVTVGSTGIAYLTGRTVSTDFPTTAGAYQPANRGGPAEGFVAALKADGSGFQYSTYLGGTGNDFGNRVRVDSDGAAYVAGQTSSASGSTTNDFPTTAGALQTTFGGAAGTATTGPNDAFVTKIAPDGTRLEYSTFLGGPAADTGRAIALGSDGAAYVTGATSSATAFGTPGAYKETLAAGGGDAYAAKLSPDGSALAYATYLGGTKGDDGRGIAVDADGNAYLTGTTDSTDFPTENPAQASNASAPGPFPSDPFVTKLNPEGSGLVYSTYIGSNTFDNATDIAVDGGGNAYAVGNTLGDFPLKDPVQVRTGDYDGYLAKFDAAGQIAYSTIYGGGSRDFNNAVAVDGAGNAYIAGRTDYYSPGAFPVRNAFQPLNNGFADAFVAKISSAPAAPLVNAIASRSGPVVGGTKVVITGTGLAGATAVRFGATGAASYTVDSPTQITAVSPPHAAGKVNVTVTTAAGTTPANPVSIFEYADGVWKLTGSLNDVHYDHQMRLLDNGKVLLIGGNNAMFGDNIGSSELYDPKTGQWGRTAALGTPRSTYTATRLDGPACRSAGAPAYCGDILVAGGSANSARTNLPLATAEVYDAASDAWTATAGNLNTARSQHAATLLDGPECQAAGPPSYCGKVLVTGGLGRPATANVPLSSAELYDPATGLWTPTGAMQHTARLTSSVLLSNGRVLLAGGIGSDTAATEIYDPATGNWDKTDDLNIGRERHTLVALPNGKVLAASGIPPGDPPHLGTPPAAGDSAELYDVATGTWTLLPDRLEGAARNNHDTAVLPDGRALLAGGGRGGLTAELFEPGDGTWRSAGLLNRSRGSGHPQTGSYQTVVLSSDPTRFAADRAVCGEDCGKVLVAGNSDNRTAELYTPRPTIDALAPSSGSAAGGTSVKIAGQGFTHDVRAVLFGDTPAASFTIDSYGQITAISPAGSGETTVSVINEGGKATSSEPFVYLAAGSPGPPDPPAPPAPQAPPAGEKFTAKLSLARATINRKARTLDVLAPITSLASGRVNVELHAAGRRYRFTALVNSRDGRIRFQKRIPAAQARLGTGILTIIYRGDVDTRPQKVRLRAARQQAQLLLQRPTIASNGRLRASGTVNDRARGVVRVQLEYVAGGETKTHQFLAKIGDGRWSLNQKLSETVRNEIAQRTGTVHSYTLVTGYMAARMRGEMRSFQVLGPR